MYTGALQTIAEKRGKAFHKPKPSRKFWGTTCSSWEDEETFGPHRHECQEWKEGQEKKEEKGFEWRKWLKKGVFTLSPMYRDVSDCRHFNEYTI